MFSLARALPSPISAEACPSLFDRFTGTMARSDSSETRRSAVRLFAFSDRARSWLDREVPEVSRFSCMLFLSVRGFLDYAGPVDHSRYRGQPCCLPPWGWGRRPDPILFEAQYPDPPIPLSMLRRRPHGLLRKTQGQDGVAFSFPVGILPPLQHAGLSRRTPGMDSNDELDRILKSHNLLILQSR